MTNILKDIVQPPADTKPVDVVVDTKPADAAPIDTKSVDNTPVQTAIDFEISKEELESIDAFTKSLEKPTDIVVDTKPKDKTIEVPAEIKQELETLKAETEILKNPVVKSIAELINSGGDITSLFIQQGKDHTKSTQDEVLNDYMADIYGDEKDKIPTAVADFKKKYTTDFEIRTEIAKMREILATKYPANYNKQFEEKLGGAVKAVKESTSQRLTEQSLVRTSFETAYTIASQTLDNLKEFNGIPLSVEDKEKILAMTRHTTPFQNKKADGAIGLDIAMKAYLYEKALVEAKKQGVREYAQYKARVSKQGASAIPGANGAGHNSMLESVINQDKK